MRGLGSSRWGHSGWLLLSVALLLVVGIIIWGLASALAASPRPSPSSGKVILRLGWTAGPDNLNPFIGYDALAFTVWYMNYDTLVGLNTTDVAPNKTTGLATGWTTSPDGKTWTFTIRKDAKWQDGVPLTAADVAWTTTRSSRTTSPTGRATRRAS